MSRIPGAYHFSILVFNAFVNVKNKLLFVFKQFNHFFCLAYFF